MHEGSVPSSSYRAKLFHFCVVLSQENQTGVIDSGPGADGRVAASCVSGIPGL